MRNQFTFYSSYYEAVKELPKKEQVNVILAICGYALMDEEPELTGVSKAIFTLIRPTLDASKAKAENGRRGGKAEAKPKQTESKAESKPKQTQSENEREIENECYKTREVSRFVPPSVSDVAAYCLERRNGIDAQNFVDFYSSKGWMIGKNKMKDWRAAVRTWERSRSADTAIGNPEPPQTENPRSRFVPTGEFEGYWEDFIDGKWVRCD